MKKLLLIVGVLLIIGGSVYSFTDTSEDQKHSASSGVNVNSTAPEKRQEQAQGVQPRRLIIPKLGISAAVEYVGMDERGRMDVPKNDDNVAWFELGYQPGTHGNAVMAGHLDRSNGTAAVFYRLDELRSGDTIQVEAADGSTITFIVTQKAIYPDATFPLTEVFGPTDKKRLNLITCEGRYDQSSRNYSHRTVVYSELAP